MTSVSVIIPNYNHTQFLVEAIQSVLQQTRPADEIIVVDDGSTDNCRDVVAGFAAQVKYVWQENKGLAGARNTGIQQSTGQYIGLLDADDSWAPTYLENMLSLAVHNPDGAVFYCQARCVDKHGVARQQVLGGPPRVQPSLHRMMVRANFLIPSTILLRRDKIMAAGLFDDSLRSCEDWDLWLRILPEARFYGSEAVLVNYRQHDASLSKDLSGMHNAAHAVIIKNFGADDGQFGAWSEMKRLAFGGLYRYFALTYVQRQGDWESAAEHLCLALERDSTLATDLDLFYELALGTQAVGFRGTAQLLCLTENARQIKTMLSSLFSGSRSHFDAAIERRVYGTAYFAIGLVAYNTKAFALSRRFLSRAVFYRPELIFEARVTMNLLKTLVRRNTS